LIDETSDHKAISTIAASEILRREAEAAMPALRAAALRPATRDEIKRIVGQRFELFPQPKRDDGQWAAWWADYFDALEGLTPFAVEAGMAAWVRSPEAEFMCKPGKLAELAKTTANVNRWAKAHYRAEHATAPAREAAVQPSEPTRPEDRPTAEEVARVMADLKQKLEERDPWREMKSKAARPTPSAAVDETGVSAEMRVLLQQRYAGR
jgi:hypothetical protein